MPLISVVIQNKMNLPKFKYHKDPLKTKSIIENLNNKKCECCEEVKEYIYNGSFYSRHGRLTVCPWCIANGIAYEKFDASFNTEWGLLNPDPTIQNGMHVSPDILNEVVHKTPGFSSFNEVHWPYHCNDACRFIGESSIEDLKIGKFVNDDCGIEALEEQRVEYLEAASKKESLESYFFTFECLTCNIKILKLDLC